MKRFVVRKDGNVVGRVECDGDPWQLMADVMNGRVEIRERTAEAPVEPTPQEAVAWGGSEISAGEPMVLHEDPGTGVETTPIEVSVGEIGVLSVESPEETWVADEEAAYQESQGAETPEGDTSTGRRRRRGKEE